MLIRMMQWLKRGSDSLEGLSERPKKFKSGPIYIFKGLTSYAGAFSISLLLAVVPCAECQGQTEQRVESTVMSQKSNASESESFFEKIITLSGSEVESVTFILGLDRIEEGSGKYNESNLLASRCSYATRNSANILRIVDILKGSDVRVREKLSAVGWEPREGIFLQLKSGATVKITLDNNLYWKDALPGSADGTAIFVSPSIQEKLYKWAKKVERKKMCEDLLFQYKNR